MKLEVDKEFIELGRLRRHSYLTSLLISWSVRPQLDFSVRLADAVATRLRRYSRSSVENDQSNHRLSDRASIPQALGGRRNQERRGSASSAAMSLVSGRAQPQ